MLRKASTVALALLAVGFSAAGALTDQFAYNAHGEVVARTGTTVTPFQFVGAAGVRSEGGALYRMGARFYDAGLRRFLSPDPLGIDGGFNLYAYADADPVNRIDPLGLCAESGWGRGGWNGIRSSWGGMGGGGRIIDTARYAPDPAYDGRLGYVARTRGLAAAALLGLSDLFGISSIGETMNGRDFSTGGYLNRTEMRQRTVAAFVTVAAFASMIRVAPALAAGSAGTRGNGLCQTPVQLESGRGPSWESEAGPEGRSHSSTPHERRRSRPSRWVRSKWMGVSET